MQLEHKTITSGGVQPTGEEGVVEALVSVTGIKDNVGDIIVPGAYEKTLKARTPKGVWSHNWDMPVSKVLDIKELMPGDENLPKTMADGTPWPAEAGGLYVKAQFNLDTPSGRDAYSNVMFFADNCEWSIGYKVDKGGATVDKKTQTRHIKSLNLYEYSPVLFGAASQARTLQTSIKSLQGQFESDEEFKAALLDALEMKAEDVEQKDDDISDEELIAILEEDESKDDAAEESEDKQDDEERSEAKEINLNAVVIERLESLEKEIKAVLEVALGVSEEKAVEVEIPKKSLDEAMEDILNAEVDVDHKTLVGVVKLGRADEENRSEIAIKVLDDIDAALNNASAEQEMLLKVLAQAIGDEFAEIKAEDVVEEESAEEKADETEEIETKTTISADEWAEFKALISE